MSITYSIDRQRNVVFTTVRGVLTDEDLLDHKKRLMSDPEFEPGMVELSDVREIVELAVTPEGIGRFVTQDSKDAKRLKDYKLAIVASEDVVYGMARMYQTLTEPNVPAVRIFRDLDEAKAWLGRF